MILPIIYPFQNFYVSGTTCKKRVFEIYQLHAGSIHYICFSNFKIRIFYFNTDPSLLLFLLLWGYKDIEMKKINNLVDADLKNNFYIL